MTDPDHVLVSGDDSVVAALLMQHSSEIAAERLLEIETAPDRKPPDAPAAVAFPTHQDPEGLDPPEPPPPPSFRFA